MKRKLQKGGKIPTYDKRYLTENPYGTNPTHDILPTDSPNILKEVLKNQGFKYISGKADTKDLIYQAPDKQYYYYNEHINPDSNKKQYAMMRQFSAPVAAASIPTSVKNVNTASNRSAIDFQFANSGITGYVDTTNPQGINNPVYYLDKNGNIVDFNGPDFSWDNYKERGGSIDGYREDSLDNTNPFNVIMSGHISMDNVPQRLLGIDDTEDMRVMIPGMDEHFMGNMVLELPLGKKGGMPTNKGFLSLPRKIQEKILKSRQNGGQPDYNLSSAEKVTNVPNDFSHYKDEGSKKYFVKTVPLQQSNNSGTQTQNPKSYEQTIVNLLKSGVTPEQILSENLVSTQAMTRLRNNYVPKIVYTDPQLSTAQTTNLPLMDERLTNRKRSELNSGQIVQITRPDSNAGYSVPTNFYFDPTTNRQIDNLKSYDASGKYTPVYRSDDPTKFLMDDPETYGAKTQYINNAVGDTSKVNLNTNTQTRGFQFGGGLNTKDLKKFLKQSYQKQNGGQANTQTAPQNTSTESYLDMQNAQFLNKLQQNVMGAMVDETVNNAEQGFYKYGGMYKAQSGRNGIPNESVYPDMVQNNGLDFNMPMAEDITPQFNTNFSPQQTTYSPNVNLESQARIDFNNKRGITDPNLAMYSDEDLQAMGILSQGQNTGPNWKKIGNNFSQGLQIFNNLSANNAANLQQSNIKDQMRLDKMTKATNGSRGDYDPNSGMFRVNQTTPAQYQVGGQYEMSDDEIQQFLKMGGKVKYV